MQSSIHTQPQPAARRTLTASMRSTLMRMLQFTIAVGTLVSLVACGDAYSTGTNQPPYDTSIAGTYVATTFVVTRQNQAPVNALEQGAVLTITIAADNSASGSLFAPLSVTGGIDPHQSMAGSVTRTGASIRFVQPAETFVRDLVWTLSGRTISAVDAAQGTTRFTITLQRQ
jgi:hypothetical protein